MKYYRNAQGAYLGSYSDNLPAPQGGYLVDVAPAHAAMIYQNDVWTWPKSILKARVEEKCWKVETGGMSVNGVLFRTDDRSKSLIHGTFAYLKENPGLTADWEIDADTTVQVGLAQIEPVFNALGAHVQACFTARKNAKAAVEAGTITTPEQIESWPGWPSNG